MRRPLIIYFRPGGPECDAEIAAARRHFSVVTRRDDIPPDSTVLCRYSALPFAEDLEAFLATRGCDMLVPVRDQARVSNIGQWYPILGKLTFDTWMAIDLVPDHAFPVVIKGATNSRKQEWKEKMFARDRAEAHRVMRHLSYDPLLGTQRLYFRRFEELRKVAEAAADAVPYSDEHRFFMLDGEPVAAGFYWSEARTFTAKPSETHGSDMYEFVTKAADRLLKHGIRFVAIDIARTAAGELRVVEIGDPQMAGISTIDPDTFYTGLWLGLSCHQHNIKRT